MKVLWILPGSESNLQDMVFARRTMPKLLEIGVEVECFFLESRSSITYLIKSWFYLRKKIRHTHYEAIHAQYGSLNGAFVGLLFHPFFVTLRGSDINGDPGVSPLRRFLSISLSYLAARWARKTICVSQKIAHKLPFSTVILPSPIDLDKFRPLDKLQVREILRLNTSKIHTAEVLVGFAGGSRPLKRRDLARHACELAGYKLLEIVSVRPDEMPIWINACDVLLLTSEREGSPNIVKEALACGVPIVSVDVGDVAKWLSLDSASQIVEADPQVLGNALREVIAKNFRRERRVDLSELNLENHAHQLKLIYQSV